MSKDYDLILQIKKEEHVGMSYLILQIEDYYNKYFNNKEVLK